MKPISKLLIFGLLSIPTICSAHNFYGGGTKQNWAARDANLVIEKKCASLTTCPKCNQEWTWTSKMQQDTETTLTKQSTQTGNAAIGAEGEFKLIKGKLDGSWTGTWTSGWTSVVKVSGISEVDVKLPKGDCEQFGGYNHYQWFEATETVEMCSWGTTQNAETEHCAWNSSTNTCTANTHYHIPVTRSMKEYTLNVFSTFDANCKANVDGAGAIAPHPSGSPISLGAYDTSDHYICPNRHSYLTCYVNTLGCS